MKLCSDPPLPWRRRFRGMAAVSWGSATIATRWGRPPLWRSFARRRRASGSAGWCAQPGMRQDELGVMRAGRSDGDLDATDGDGDAGAEFEQLQADGAAGRLRQLGVRQTDPAQGLEQDVSKR